MHHPTDRVAHTTAFVTPVVEHWLEREIAQWVKRKKEMFSLMMHSTHFIYGYMASHIAREETRCKPHALLFPISSKGSFICITPTYRIAHTITFVTPVMEHWLE